MKKNVSIRRNLCIISITVAGIAAAVALVLMFLLLDYNGRYGNLLYNVTTASEFNQEFKNSIDSKMYYYVIGSQYSEGLPLDEVRAAQDLARDLLRSTTHKDSHQAISSVLDLCVNLEEKIFEIERTENFDDRITQLENNIYVLTELVEEYMYSYLYHEAVQLNELQQSITGQIYTDIALVLFLMGIVIAAALYFSIRLSRSITAPLEALCQRAGEVSAGDLTEREPIYSDAYEVRTLSEAMEQMISRLNEQMHSAEVKQESLRRTELALLQAQINPHFLYNTMDTIIWLIEAEKTSEAVEMVSNLSSFFRHSLSRGEDLISLGEEQRHVESYLQIQHVRYKDILSYSVDIDPVIHRCLIPKLTLQPLVENALYHGIKLRRGMGMIKVRGCLENGKVLLQVEDNGAGMSPQRLEQLRRSISEDERVGFGFSAVNQRLQLQFGSEYSLEIESEIGKGCLVSIRIPFHIKEEIL